MITFKVYSVSLGKFLVEFSEKMNSNELFFPDYYIVSQGVDDFPTSNVSIFDGIKNLYLVTLYDDLQSSTNYTLSINGIHNADGSSEVDYYQNFTVNDNIISSCRFNPAIQTMNGTTVFTSDYIDFYLTTSVVATPLALTRLSDSFSPPYTWKQVSDNILRIYSDKFSADIYQLSINYPYEGSDETGTFTFMSGCSARNRMILVKNGIIAKADTQIQSGSDLYISSPKTVDCTRSIFTNSDVGRFIKMENTIVAVNRNNGTYRITKCINPNRVELEEANLNNVNVVTTQSSLFALVNDIILKFNSHIMSLTSHYVDDHYDLVDPVMVDTLSNHILALNTLRSKYILHVNKGWDDKVHNFSAENGGLDFPICYDLISAIYLANILKRQFDEHRTSANTHKADDIHNIISAPAAKIKKGSGDLYGPYIFQVLERHLGSIADSPLDVSIPGYTVESVHGLLGAIVLAQKPASGSQLEVGYNYIPSPSGPILKIQSSEYHLNAGGGSPSSGLPEKKYKFNNYLPYPKLLGNAYTSLKQSSSPFRRDIRYKAIQKSYSSVLNDPTTFILNVPTNRISVSTSKSQESEKTISYSPTILPTSSNPPWAFTQFGSPKLKSGPSRLEITDVDTSSYIVQGAPLYSQKIDATYPGSISLTTKMAVTGYPNIDAESVIGVGLGISDGSKVYLLNTLLTEVNNLSSALVVCNALKSALSTHVVANQVHLSVDSSIIFLRVNAFDLDSCIDLANEIKSLLLSHISHGGSGSVHKSVGSPPDPELIDSFDLSSLCYQLNTMRIYFNSHMMDAVVHVSQDTADIVSLCKQIGVWTASGPMGIVQSYECTAVDWTKTFTYRLSRDVDGLLNIYTSNESVPSLSLSPLSLPNAASANLPLNDLNSIFFGSLGYKSANISEWYYVRGSTIPSLFDNVNVAKNVKWEYTQGLPYLTSNNLWTLVGQSGVDKIQSNSMLLDNISNSNTSESEAAGKLTGEYRGYIRVEPGITDMSTVDLSFSLGPVDLAGFGVSNLALGAHISDGRNVTSLAFLQDNNGLPRFVYNGLRIPTEINPDYWKCYGVADFATIEDRHLRIQDTLNSDFCAFDFSQGAPLNSIITPTSLYSVDFQFKVNSASPNSWQYFSGYRFSGGRFSVDESSHTDGKNIEVHLASDDLSCYFIVCSYDSELNELVQIGSAIPFNWNDGLHHSFTIRNMNSKFKYFIDGVYIGEASRTLFKSSYTNMSSQSPSIQFGSGAPNTALMDLSSCKSDMIWYSVAALKEDVDPDKRYIGVYVGGDPSSLSSYVKYKHDWMGANHSYRFLRDPTSGITVSIDGSNVPVIITDSISKAISLNHMDFLSNSISSNRFVAFGSFSDSVAVRSKWQNVAYSIRRYSQQDNLVPAGSYLNRGNASASPEHLRSPVRHRHFGFTTGPEGTPSDDYYANGAQTPGLVLAEDVPPFEITQSMRIPRDFIKQATPISSLTPETSENAAGFIQRFVSDPNNLSGYVPLSVPSTYNNILARYELIRSALMNHASLAKSHVTVKPITLPSSSALSGDTPYNRMILKDYCLSLYEAVRSHALNASLHCKPNPFSIPSAPITTQLIDMLNISLTYYQTHHTSDTGVHNNTVVIKLIAPEVALYDQAMIYTEDEGMRGMISTMIDEESDRQLVTSP